MKKLLLLFVLAFSVWAANAQQQCMAYFTANANPGTTVLSLQGYAYNYDSTQINVTSWTWTVGNNYTLTGQNVTAQFNAPGYYNVCLQIQTDIGCTTTYCDSVLVGGSNPCNMAVNGSVTHVTSAGNGSIDISVFGGTAPYAYIWNTGSTAEDLYNLSIGTYQVTATDVNGCAASAAFTVTYDSIPNQDTALYLYVNTYAASSPSSCDGSAYVEVYGGTPPYSYTLMNGTVTYSQIGQLCPGTYTVVVTDSNGLTGSYTFTITSGGTPGDSILIVTLTTNPTSSNGACDGSVYFDVMGGTAPYVIFLNNSNATDSMYNQYYMDNLCAGVYTATIMDANGLTQTVTFIIDNGYIPSDSSLVVSLTYGANPNSAGPCNLYIMSSVFGGTPPYAYMWENGATTQNVDALCAGFYCLTVTDAAGEQAYGCISIANYDSTNTYPQDTIYSQIDTCVVTTSVDSAWVGGVYTNANGVYVNWIFVIDGDTVAFDQEYYINEPGTYMINLVVNCTTNGKSLLMFSDTYDVTEEDLTVTGIYTSKVSNLNVYPNPAINDLYIDGAQQVKSVAVYNIAGQMVICKNNQVQKLDVSNLAEGTYIIEFTMTDNSKSVRKFIK